MSHSALSKIGLRGEFTGGQLGFCQVLWESRHVENNHLLSLCTQTMKQHCCKWVHLTKNSLSVWWERICLLGEIRGFLVSSSLCWRQTASQAKAAIWTQVSCSSLDMHSHTSAPQRQGTAQTADKHLLIPACFVLLKLREENHIKGDL